MSDDIITIVDFEFFQNEDWVDSLILGDPDDTSWSLDDKSLEIDLRKSPQANDEVIEVRTDNGRIVINDPDTRQISFNVLTDADTLLVPIPVGKYVYDCVLVDETTGARDTIFRGSIKVRQGVTRKQVS